MSTPSGALAPTTIQGEVLTPDAVVDPVAFPAHDFFNVMRDVVHRGGVYHTEEAVNGAVRAVGNFEKHFLKADHRHVLSEDDIAPREDVSQRIPPRVGNVPVPASAPAIDYNKLAAALMAAGFGQPPAVESDEGGDTK